MIPENLIDCHCHLDLLPDFPQAVEECERGGVYTLTMTTTPKAWPRNRELTARSRFVRAALGLHPQLISTHPSEIELWETYLPEARYIGEVGIDSGPRFFRSLELQKTIFERILRKCSQAGDKVLSVHSVRAGTMVLDMIEKYMDRQHNRVILHWFTGSKTEAKRASDLGCYFSLNPQMLDGPRHREMVAALPFERILTETDAPFSMYRGAPLQPGQVSQVLDTLAELKQMTVQDVAKRVKSNFVTLGVLQT